MGIGPAGLALSYEEQERIPRSASRKRKATRPRVPSRSLSTPVVRLENYAGPNLTQSEPLKWESNVDRPRTSASHGTGLRPAFWKRMSGGPSQFQNSTQSLSRQSSVGARRSLMSKTDRDASPSVDGNDLGT